MQAASARQLEVIHALLDAGADVTQRDHEGKTVVDIATAMNDHLLARALASRTAAPTATGNTPLPAAPTRPRPLPLSLLQAAEDQDLQGMEALMSRLRHQKRDVAAALNQRGKLRDANGNVTAVESTPLLTAIKLGNATLVATLVQAGADPELTDADGKTPLIVAIEHGHAALVDVLLDAGAQVEGKDGKQSWTPVMHAVVKGDAHLVKVLLGWTPEINHVCPDGWTALTLAAREGHEQIVSLLLQANASVDLCDVNAANTGIKPYNINKITALIIAAAKGHLGILQHLLKAGAKVDQSGAYGKTALMLAADSGQTATMQALLQAGAKVDQAITDGWTALMYAAYEGHTAALEVLLQAGAKIDQADTDGWTALMYAALNGHTETLQALLQAGATVDQAKPNGLTALMCAAENGHIATLQALLQTGADCNLQSNSGETVLSIAIVQQHDDIVELLRSHLARTKPHRKEPLNS